MITELKCGAKTVSLDTVQVMGILNMTPDSFSDGGTHFKAGHPAMDQALDHARRMIAAGATIIDVGGESTRPGADPVSEAEELDRVIPVVEQLAREFDVMISVDTSTPAVMTESAKVGAGMINDVRSLVREGALEAARDTGLSICLMHMQGASPATMQLDPQYQDITTEVCDYLEAQVERCVAAGIDRDLLVIDPGFGFGKTLQHNLRLLQELDQLNKLGLPILSGTSRKSMVGNLLDKPADQRLFGSLATVVMAVERGAKIIRVHDVEATVDAVRMTEAVLQAGLN